MKNKFTKNKNIDLNIYREMALDSECELPCAIDEQNVNIRPDGIVGTITTDGSSPKHNNRVLQTDLKIRKLTPKECFRLQGFNDSDFEKAEAVNSNTQLYKQAGNSICVPVVEHIISALIDSGVFGGQAKQPVVFAEGQLSFTDCVSFDRYMDYYKKENETWQ